MNLYVNTGTKVIEVAENEADSLFAYLWEYTEIEKLGAETDNVNSFGAVTHLYKEDILWKRVFPE